jgi:HSP20 family protein
MSKVANIAPKEKEVAVRETPRRGARMLTPFEEMDRLFDRLTGFGPRWMHPLGWQWPSGLEGEEGPTYRMPRIDVVDRDDAVMVRAELPGVEKKDLDVSVREDTLTIRATTHREEKEEKGEYHRSEITHGEFLRSLTLPAAVDGTKAKASLKDGLLELTLPKVEPARKTRITVEG